MNNPAPASINTFALTPPQILLKTDLISHPQAHIGLSIVNHYKDPAGVLVLFGPWFGQAKYETVKLYVNGNPNPVASEIVMDSSVAVELRLSMGLLVEDVNTLHCKVERPSGNGESSPDLNVLYFIYAPGGDDPIVGGGHSALSISVSPTSVDAAQAAKGVALTLNWPHKHLYDLVTVDCGGVLLTHRVEPTPQDPVPDLTKPVFLTLYTQHFAHDPNNPQFLIKYNVVSQTDNLSGTTHKGNFDAQDHWSVPFPIAVHLDRKELEMPILQEILGDNSDDPTKVDLGKLKGGPLWALIHLIQTIWQAGDEIRLMFTAVVNGSVVATHEATLPITQVPGQFAWDIPNDKVIADSIVRVRFEQIRGGEVIGVSSVAEAQVIGKAEPTVVVENFDSRDDVSIYPGQNLELPAMTVRYINNARPGSTTHIYSIGTQYPGRIEGKVLLLGGHGSSKHRVEFKELLSNLTVWVYTAVGNESGGVASFYTLDRNGIELERHDVPIPKFFLPPVIENVAFSKGEIASLEIETRLVAGGHGTNVIIDNIKMTI